MRNSCFQLSGTPWQWCTYIVVFVYEEMYDSTVLKGEKRGGIWPNNKLNKTNSHIGCLKASHSYSAAIKHPMYLLGNWCICAATAALLQRKHSERYSLSSCSFSGNSKKCYCLYSKETNIRQLSIVNSQIEYKSNSRDCSIRIQIFEYLHTPAVFR